MRFTKMQGLGNDYVFLDCTKRTPENLPDLAVKLSDRHWGVGSDGLICILPSASADFQMRIFNADGSEGEMCGNGIRCVGKYVYDHRMIQRETVVIDTLAGRKQLYLAEEHGTVVSVTVDMGIPYPSPSEQWTVLGNQYQVYPISMGNPHVVLFLETVQELNLAEIGPAFSCHPSFPDRTNVEFTERRGEGRLFVRVWERGSGETMACGTGACAAAVAACIAGIVSREVTVTMPGGDLTVCWSEENGHVYLTGPAVTVFEGDWPD